MNRSLAARMGVMAAALAIGVLGALALAAPARAATLTQVSSFGSNPGNLTMYSYRPDGLPGGSPAVVLLHGCTQNADTYFTNSGWRKYADQWGFALIVAEQKSANNSNSCFNWFQAGDTARGQGEALSIRSMVSYGVSTYGLDSSRIYLSGLSAGGAMSAVMLATYPDVFAAGSIIAGIPYRCATSLGGAFGCMNPGVDKTPAQWGDLVRGAYPGYGGRYPRVAIWHGSSDTTVVPRNATESVEQWTDVRGVSQTPTSTRDLGFNTTLKVYGGDVVRLYQISGMGHGTPVRPGSGTDQCGTAAAYFLNTICAAYHEAVFFGLSGGTPPPSPSPSPKSDPVCVTSSNYSHTTAGRAYHSGGYTYANGSHQNMGLWNTYTTTTLKQTGPNYWVIGC